MSHFGSCAHPGCINIVVYPEETYCPFHREIGWSVAIVGAELARARSKFPPFHSAHEGYAVILEELSELWEEVRKYPKYDLLKLQTEAIQTAAMALRFAEDICGSVESRRAETPVQRETEKT